MDISAGPHYHVDEYLFEVVASMSRPSPQQMLFLLLLIVLAVGWGFFFAVLWRPGGDK